MARSAQGEMTLEKIPWVPVEINNGPMSNEGMGSALKF
jgi:hypothetical protein